MPTSFLSYGKLRASWGKNGSLSNLSNYSAATPHTSLGRIGRLAGDLAEGALSIAALIFISEANLALMRYSAMAGAIAGGCTRALFNYANGFRFAHS